MSLTLPQAQANLIPINGSIGFAGTVIPSGATLNTSSSLTDISATVVSDAGTYTPIIPLTSVPATFPNLTVTGAGAGIASPLWTVVNDGITYQFFATSKTSESDVAGSGFLEIGGGGYAVISGGVYAQTEGTWILTASQSGSGAMASFGFESTGTFVGNVPDSSMTLGLLGSAMLALQGLRRKLGC